MREPFPLAAFVTRWNALATHNLTSSDSEALSLSSLLALADGDDLCRWQDLRLDYPDPRGSDWLRETIAGRHPGLHADDVLCCAGAQEAIACVAHGLLERDDHAIVVLPIYEPSERALTSRCAVTGIALKEATGWTLDLENIAAAIRPNTKMIAMNFPNSPTGAPINPATLASLVELCRTRGLWLVNDEVYWQTDCATTGRAAPVVDVYERGVSINGLSKGFGLPGLRVGWVACRDREALTRACATKSQLSSCLASASEVLANIAIKAETSIIRRRRAIGRSNYRRLSSLFGSSPGLLQPEVLRNLAFVFPRYLGPGCVESFAVKLAEEAGILVLPSTLWRSSLAPVTEHRLRIGLGHIRSGSGLQKFTDYAARHSRLSLAA